MSSQLAIGVVIGASVRAGFTSVFGRAQNTVKDLGGEIQRVKSKQEALGRSIAKGIATGKGGLGAMRAQYDVLGKSIEKATRAQQKLTLAIAKQEKAKVFRGNLRTEMMETAGHGAVAAAPVISAVKFFLKEESAETDLKMAMQKSDGSFGAFETLRKEVIKLGKDLPGTTSEFYRLGKVLKSQGLSDTLLTNGGLNTSAKLNTVMEMGQEQGGEFFAKLIEARGLKESEFAKAADITQRAYFGFGMKKEDMFDSMKYNAPTMNPLGIKGLKNYENAMAIEGMGAQVGLEGSQFGTNFSMMLDQMAAGPKQLAMAKSGMKKVAKDILAKSKIDFEFFDKKGKFKGLEGMVGELEKLKKIKNEQGEAAALIVADELFGAQAKRTALTIAEKGAAGLAANLKLMREQADLDARIATKTATLGAALESLGGVAEHTAAIFGGVFVKDIQAFAKTAQNFLENDFQPWLEKNKDLIKSVAAVTVGLFAGKLAILGLSYGFSMLMMPIRTVSIGLAKMGATFRLFQLMRLGKIGKMSMLLRMFGMSAKTAAKVSSMFSSILSRLFTVGGRFINLIKNIGTAFVRSFPLIKAFGQGLLGGFSSVFKIFGLLAKFAGIGLFKGIVAGFKMFSTAAGYVARFLPVFGQAFMVLGRMLLATPIGIALGLLAVAAYMLYNNWESVVNGAKSLWQDLGYFFNGLWQSIQELFNSSIANISTTIINWSPIGLFYQSFAAVMNWFGFELPAKFTGFGQMLVDGLINGIKAKISTAIAVMKNFAAKLQSGFTVPNKINSPSRIFMQYGEFLTSGLNIGIQRSYSKPIGSMQRLAGKLQQGMQLVQAEKLPQGMQLAQAEKLPQEMKLTETGNLSEVFIEYSELSNARSERESIQANVVENKMTIHFNPTYHINSQTFNAEEAAKFTMRDFEDFMKRYQADLQRRSY